MENLVQREIGRRDRGLLDRLDVDSESDHTSISTRSRDDIVRVAEIINELSQRAG